MALLRKHINVLIPFILLSIIGNNLLLLRVIKPKRYRMTERHKENQRYSSVRHYGMSQEFKILEINLFSDNLGDNTQKL